MLNRRMLRIKVMQSLFAYEQCKEANYQLADAHIEETFQPDLNSMEVQDKKQIASNRKVARQLFEIKFKKPDTPDDAEPVVNKTVKEALDLYLKQTKKDFTFLSKNMVIEVEKLSGYYYAVLGLMVALADQAAADKK